MSRFLEALAAFLARHGIFLTISVLAIVLAVRRSRSFRKRMDELFDASLVPDWTDRRVSALQDSATGNWLGHRATLRRTHNRAYTSDFIEATLEPVGPGRFVIERRDVSVLHRSLWIGGPPPFTLVNPDDEARFRVRSADRTPDRLLASVTARSALLECLREPANQVSLKEGRLRVYRMLSTQEPVAPIVRQTWVALKEMAGVLG